MEKLIVVLTKWLLSKFAPRFHVHGNPKKVVMLTQIRSADDEAYIKKWMGQEVKDE